MRPEIPRRAAVNLSDLLRGSDRALKALRMRYGIKKTAQMHFAAYV